MFVKRAELKVGVIICHLTTTECEFPAASKFLDLPKWLNVWREKCNGTTLHGNRVVPEIYNWETDRWCATSFSPTRAMTSLGCRRRPTFSYPSFWWHSDLLTCYLATKIGCLFSQTPPVSVEHVEKAEFCSITLVSNSGKKCKER